MRLATLTSEGYHSRPEEDKPSGEGAGRDASGLTRIGAFPKIYLLSRDRGPREGPSPRDRGG